MYLYSGEQNDPNLGLYYLRARYLSQSTGRFWTMDTVEGESESPISLHKYTYLGNEPVVRLDPSGNQFDIASVALEVAVDSLFGDLSSIATRAGFYIVSKVEEGIAVSAPVDWLCDQQRVPHNS